MKKTLATKYLSKIILILLMMGSTSLIQAQEIFYWVGKGSNNNWSNLENWEVNGLKPSEIPDISDQVIVDDSKFSTDQTIVIDQNAVCLSVDMTALATHNVTVQTNGNSITVNGDFKLSDKVSIPISSANLWTQIPIRLTGGTNGQTYALSFGGKNHPYVSVSINTNGSYLINEDTQIGRMLLGTGTLEVSSGKTLDLRGFLANNDAPKTLKMAGATILSVAPNWSGTWKAKNFTLEDDNTSLIKLTGTEILMQGDNVTYNKVEFGDSNSSNIQLTDQVTIKNAIFYAGANFTTNGITFHDLVMNAGTNTSAYSFGSGVEIFVTNSLQANGSCTNPILWTSATQGKVNFTGTNFTANYIDVNGVINSSSNTLTLNDSHSLIDPNATNDQGWVIVPSTSRDLYWIGGTNAAKSHNWSEVENWAVGSVSGTQATCIPDANDNVFFVEASFIGGGSTEVTVNLRNISCHNMTWSDDITATTNPTFKNLYSHNSSTPNNLFIYGSLKFDSNMNQDFIGNTFFKGSGTITSEGKDLKAVVHLNTSGTYSLNDAFKTTSAFYLQSGTFDLNNQDFSCAHFFSKASDTQGDRTLKLGNSKLYIALNWTVESTLISPIAPYPLTIEEGTSTIYMTSIHEGGALGAMFKGGFQNYYHIEYTNTGAKTASLSHVNNVVDVRVKNRSINIGNLYTLPLRINKLTFSENASGGFYGNNSYGEVILDPGQVYTFYASNTQTIDVKLTAPGTCSSPITLKSSNDNASTTLNLSALDASSQYLLINRVNAVNTTNANVDFVANNSQNIGNANVTGWSLVSSPRTLYWVGSLNPSGTGNWGDQANWSLSSGGAGGECLPTPNDDVIFDTLSFSGTGSQEVKMNTTLQTCKSITWTTGVPSTAQWTGNTNLEVHGSFTLAPNMTNNYEGVITFKTTVINAIHTIDTKGVALNKHIVFNGDATWNLLSNLKINNNSVWGNGRIVLNQGTFDLQGNDLDITWFQALNTAQPHKLIMTNSNVRNLMNWEAYSANFTLEANNSLIEFQTGTAYFNGGSGLTYHNVHFKVANHAYLQLSNNITFNDVTFNANTTNIIRGTGHSFKKVTFNSQGTIEGSHTFENLIFTQGNTYHLESGQTQTILNDWLALGGNCSTTIIQSTTDGQPAIVTKSTGTVEGTFLTLKVGCLIL